MTKFLSDEQLRMFKEVDEKCLSLIPKDCHGEALRNHPAWIIHMSIMGRVEQDFMDRFFSPRYYQKRDMTEIIKKAREDVKKYKVFST